MKWNLGWTITTKSVHDKTYRIEIYTQDSVSEVIELMPAKIAFEYKTENDEDPYTSIRGSVGTIRFITQRKIYRNDNSYFWVDLDSVSNVESDKLRPKQERDRLVRVLVDGSLIWVGFLSCEEYTGEFVPLNHIREIEIPCKSILECMKDVPFSVDTRDSYFNFAGTLVKSLCKISDIESSELSFILKNTLCVWDGEDKNIMTKPISYPYYITVENGQIKGKSYYEILSDMLFFYDLQLFEYFGNLEIVKVCDKLATGSTYRNMIIESNEELIKYANGSSTHDIVEHRTHIKDYSANSDIESNNNEVLTRKPVGSVILEAANPDRLDFDYSYSNSDFHFNGRIFQTKIDNEFVRKLYCDYSSSMIVMRDGVSTFLVDRWNDEDNINKKSLNYHPEFNFPEVDSTLYIGFPSNINKSTASNVGGFIIKFSLTEFTNLTNACQFLIFVGNNLSYNGWNWVNYGASFFARFDEDGRLLDTNNHNVTFLRNYTNADGGLVVLFDDNFKNLVNDNNINGILTIQIRSKLPLSLKDLSVETLIENKNEVFIENKPWTIKDNSAEIKYENDTDNKNSVSYNFTTIFGNYPSIKSRSLSDFDPHNDFSIHMRKKQYVRIGNLYLRFPHLDDNNVEHGIFPMNYISERGRKLRLLSHSLNSYNDNGECLFLDTNFYEE